jgi:hypothetical protein
MVNLGRQIGGECFHVADSYVWAEIQYLDSPTDYREFLPLRSIQPMIVNSDLVMLDSGRRATPKDPIPLALVFLIPVIIILLVLYFEV